MSNKYLLIITLITALILILDIATPLDIHSSHIVFLLFAVTIITAIAYINRITSIFSPLVLVGLITFLLLVFSVVDVLFIYGWNWKIQNIKYINRESKSTTIEFQMRDIGARGYSRRTVEKTKLFPGISWLKEINPNQHVDTTLWKAVNIEVNEIRFKEI